VTRRVDLLYGSGFLPVEFPPNTTIIESVPSRPHADPTAAVAGALRDPTAGPPLAAVISDGARVVIAVCDGTRPQPRQLILPPILDEVVRHTPLERVTVLIATGTHRGNTAGELASMLGPDLLRRVRVVNHDARDPAGLIDLGRMGCDVPVHLNREWVEADVRISTGFVEPHFFAGFSGGPKMIAPGLAGLETTLVLHDAVRIGHPSARFGLTVGNPVHDDIRAIAAGCAERGVGVDFACDVVLDGDQRIVEVFAGSLPEMHLAAIEASRALSMRPVGQRFDVVVTTNAGYPLDQNLYQAVKGMAAAAKIVRLGGLIIVAAECRDGFPDHGGYRDALLTSEGPSSFLKEVGARAVTLPDQWQVQIQAAIQVDARVGVHATGVSADELTRSHLIPIRDIGAAVRAELGSRGPAATCAVLPGGPLTVPYVRAEAPCDPTSHEPQSIG
jgi:nickel-dependent lactate racemase